VSRHRAPRRTHERAPRTRTRHRFALALALVAALGVGAGGAGTYAFWNDRTDITTGSVSAGSIDLQVRADAQAPWQAVGRDTAATVPGIAFADRTPGEYEAYLLTLRNVGNPPGTYTLSVLRGAAWTYLDDAVVVQAFTGSVVDDTTYPIQKSCNGSSLGPPQTVSSASAFSLTTAARTLPAGGSETICLRIGLASGASNDNQGKSGTLVLRAVLTQGP